MRLGIRPLTCLSVIMPLFRFGALKTISERCTRRSLS